MNFQHHSLPNGIRLVHKQLDRQVAHFSFMVHTGSRDEQPHQHGMAHFIEHVIFKGTKKRKAWHILSRLEDVGGELNAYTSKEETCVYATFLKADYDRAMELISDICIHSVFPEKEINKEKGIIIDEISSYNDSPSELIFDEFEEQVFNNHAIGRSILGEEKRILSFNRNDIYEFMGDNYATDEMVLSSVGDLPFEKFIRLAEKYFGHIPAKSRKTKRQHPNSYTPRTIHSRRNTHQTHCIIGNIAYSSGSDKRIAMALLNNILGGPGMNSRLNISLREKSAYSYNVESNYTSYSDTGILNVYFGCDKENYEKSLKLTFREFDKLKNNALGSLQLSKAKKQLLGQIAIASDSNEYQMLRMGKSILLFNHVDSIKDTATKIEVLSSSDLLEVANEILERKQLSILQYY